MELQLNLLRQGDCAVVKELLLDGAMQRRLAEFGFIEGTEILCVRPGRRSGPSIYRVRGTMLALRNADCRNVYVELCEP